MDRSGSATDRRNHLHHAAGRLARRRGLESTMLEDVSVSALHAALNGLAARQRAVSDDIANVNTPYFRARKNALAGGQDPMAVTPSTEYTADPNGLTYSNVDLNQETISSVNTQLAYDLALRATGDRFTLLRSAAKGS